MEAHLPTQASRRPPIKIGETRLKQDTFNQAFQTMKQHRCKISHKSFTTPTKACTMIHNQNHKHWVKVGSPRRRMPYPYALTNITISICPTKISRNTCHPRLSIFTCLNKAIHTFSFHIPSLIPPIEQQKGIWLQWSPYSMKTIPYPRGGFLNFDVEPN